MFYGYLMAVELSQGLEVLRCKIFYTVFKGSQETCSSATGLRALWKAVQALLTKSESASNKELVRQGPSYREAGIQEGSAGWFCQQVTKS